jgi:nitroreductase
MNRIVAVVLILLTGISTSAQEIKLPAPQRTGGMPLMDALNNRQSIREFSEKEIDQQTLSNLLWAGWGINRESGKRTAPSAKNLQEIDIYVMKADGYFLYNAQNQSLIKLGSEDIRGLTGTQDFVAKAPVNLVYIADLKKAKAENFNNEPVWSYANSGFIAQNVYLYCASVDLCSVVRGSVQKDELVAKLKLEPHQKIILAQTIGWPKK